jgi:anthranilate synthase/aminodeoxychorismate synthase-like glutamine amidotransferase
MIDNYDSFTYNLVQYFSELGQEVVVERNDKISLKEIKNLKPEFLVLSPGPCTPNEAGISLDIVSSFKGKIPMLGVCLGHQSYRASIRGKDYTCKNYYAW